MARAARADLAHAACVSGFRRGPAADPAQGSGWRDPRHAQLCPPGGGRSEEQGIHLLRPRILCHRVEGPPQDIKDYEKDHEVFGLTCTKIKEETVRQ
jgi:hypothetical protein